VKEAKTDACHAIDLLDECKIEMQKYMAEDVSQHCALLEALHEQDRIMGKHFDQQDQVLRKTEAALMRESNRVSDAKYALIDESTNAR
jgi:hypothetical protein